MALPLADNVVFVNANDCNLPRPLWDIDLNTVSKSLSIYVMRYSKKEKIVFVVSVFLDLIQIRNIYIFTYLAMILIHVILIVSKSLDFELNPLLTVLHCQIEHQSILIYELVQ